MPRIGLLSDSHGHVDVTRVAVDLLLEQGARVLLHLGDIETAAVLEPLRVVGRSDGLELDVHVVFGNTDVDPGALGRHAADLGIHVDHPLGRLDLGGRVLAFTHGDDGRLLCTALSEPVAFLCHGHTHRCRDERIGATRVLNPGALYRARPRTVAVLDTDSDRVTFHPLDPTC